MKLKLSLAAIVSTSVIASGVLLASTSTAQPCSRTKSDYYQERYEQANWLSSPMAAVLILPGVAIAAALSLGDRFYRR